MKEILFVDKQVRPSKVVCVGRNYVEHIKELNNQPPGEIVLFIKPNSAISQELILPDDLCRYEGEISFLMCGNKIKGVGFGIDLTLPVVQNRLKEKGLPWEKAKGFDNSAVFSNFVSLENYQDLYLELWINGELKQQSGIKLMLHQPDELLAEINKHFSLEDNDIIMSGTPSGVGLLNRGDRIIGKVFSGDKPIIKKDWVAK